MTLRPCPCTFLQPEAIHQVTSSLYRHTRMYSQRLKRGSENCMVFSGIAWLGAATKRPSTQSCGGLDTSMRQDSAEFFRTAICIRGLS